MKGRDGVAVQPDILSHVLECQSVILPPKGESPISPHLLAILCSALSSAHVLVLGVCQASHLVLMHMEKIPSFWYLQCQV